MTKIVKMKNKKSPKQDATTRAKEAIESYVQTLKDLDPKTIAELTNSIQKVSEMLFPPQPSPLPEFIIPTLDDQVCAKLHSIVALAESAKSLGDEWDFVVQYCLKLADEIVPDEKEPK